MSRASKIRYAVVGLGYISQIAMLPAFKGARRNSELVALVSGEPRKMKKLAARYGVSACHGYDEYDALLGSGTIDAVYIGLPNTMHRDFAVRALKRGIHVLCDKPLATSVADCRRMIAAAKAGGAHLMTAYRLHFEPANLAAAVLARSGKIGRPRYFTAQFAMQIKPRNIRTQSELGGGPVFDIGIYCINAARHVFADEPIEVMAQAASADDKRFAEIDEMVAVDLKFPDERLASFVCSFGAADVAAMQIWGTKGNIKLDAAFDLAGPKHMMVETAGGRRARRKFPFVDQFAPVLLEMSDAIRTGRAPFPDGVEGMADIRVIEAIEKSLRTGRRVKPAALPQEPRQALPKSRARRVRPHPEPELIGASGPSG
jgi:glucose-fructose oxidoreductase